MITVSKDNFRSLLHLSSLGAVAAATAGVFFGTGFLLLAPPHPTTPPAPPDPPTQALEEHTVQPSANNDTAWGSSAPPPADKMAASPTPSAPSNGGAPVWAATPLEVALIPPTGIIDRERVRIGRRRHHGAGRNGTALWRAGSRTWRPDASAGPNPGRGFYGPPNVNIGYINPR
jgi:hypothetical protein